MTKLEIQKFAQRQVMKHLGFAPALKDIVLLEYSTIDEETSVKFYIGNKTSYVYDTCEYKGMSGGLMIMDNITSENAIMIVG